MSNNNDDIIRDIIGDIIIAIVILLIGFGIGSAFMYPKYGLPDGVENKLREDAKINYRSEEKHIGYIISNYYGEVKTDGSNS